MNTTTTAAALVASIGSACQVLWLNAAAPARSAVSTEWRPGFLADIYIDRAGTLRGLVDTTTPHGTRVLRLVDMRTVELELPAEEATAEENDHAR